MLGKADHDAASWSLNKIDQLLKKLCDRFDPLAIAAAKFGGVVSTLHVIHLLVSCIYHCN